jgi:dienelactone hydrolase
VVTARDVRYEADGRVMVGRLVVPEGTGKRPGVLIAHEGPGLDDHQRERATQFAEMGYVAFALDFQGGGTMIVNREAMMTRLAELASDVDRTRALGAAGLEILLGEPRVDPARVAAIGYCFGGTVVLELARSGADLKAIIGFHPGLGTSRPEDARNIKGKVLMCVGSEDPLVPPGQRAAFEDEMREGGVDWQMNLYGGAVHSFTHPRAHVVGLPHFRYDEAADKRSWQAMLDVLNEVFGQNAFPSG